jgi:hypothetical protein
VESGEAFWAGRPNQLLRAQQIAFSSGNTPSVKYRSTDRSGQRIVALPLRVLVFSAARLLFLLVLLLSCRSPSKGFKSKELNVSRICWDFTKGLADFFG